MLVDIPQQVLALFLTIALPELLDDLLIAVDLVIEPLVLLYAGAAVDCLSPIGVRVLTVLLLLVYLPGVGVVRDEGVAVRPTGLR